MNLPISPPHGVLLLTGTQLSGSGFYDPGAGFANRLGAAVGGGVVVNSVTYTNPTTLTLDLNTTGATPGAEVVTVTNPDGQAAASGAAVLTMVAAPSVVSLNRVDPTPSNASAVGWRLSFDATVSGVTAGNFALAGSAASGAAVGTPTTADGGVTWNVPVSTGPADGSLTLSLVNATGLTPTPSTALPFAGQSYTLDMTTQAPTLSAPATNVITSSPISVAFSLPETALAGSVQSLFSGTASRMLTLAASEETSAAHSFSFDPANPTLAAQIASISGGTSLPDDLYTVALSYQDLLGNPAAAAAHANVRIDTTAPVVTPPADVMAEATGAAGAVVTYPAATATDAVGVIGLTYSENSGATFPLGNTTVTVTAQDAANNVGTAAFTVTVRDTTAPALTLPSNIIEDATAGCSRASLGQCGEKKSVAVAMGNASLQLPLSITWSLAPENCQRRLLRHG